MGRLDDKVAIVTGGSTGIGLGIARAFAREGARLVLAARGRAHLDAAAAELRGLGAEVLTVPTDVTDEAQVRALFEATLHAHDRLDILVNNAGVYEGAAIDALALDAWRRVLDTNLTGPFLCTREAMRIMKRQRGGRIINIGSISAQVPRPDSAAYTASKHGLSGLTKTAQLEGRTFGISVGCLHPGNVQTSPTMSGTGEEAEPQMRPDDIAIAALAMALLPPEVSMLEAIVLPYGQPYIGRG
jgi:NAD(P)-dependent dehydrogenase (short-subunit alcohol dehydrogenase family)